jgi:hypothetical protein
LTAFQAAAATGTPVSLCVGVMPLQQSNVRGQASQWVVGAWTVGGNVPDAKLQLQSTGGAGTPTFTFGCGSGNGTSACDLGAVDASSAQRQLEAEVTVPLLATTVTTVGLTVTGSAAGLVREPAAAASISASSPPGTNLSSLSSLPPPGVAALTPTVSPGGSAANLFPTVAPGSAQAEGVRPVANVSALSGGSPVGSEIADVAGLGALAVAMFLAITRLSFRRAAPRHAAGSTAAAVSPPTAPAERQESAD